MPLNRPRLVLTVLVVAFGVLLALLLGVAWAQDSTAAVNEGMGPVELGGSIVSGVTGSYIFVRLLALVERLALDRWKRAKEDDAPTVISAATSAKDAHALHDIAEALLADRDRILEAADTVKATLGRKTSTNAWAVLQREERDDERRQELIGALTACLEGLASLTQALQADLAERRKAPTHHGAPGAGG